MQRATSVHQLAWSWYVPVKRWPCWVDLSDWYLQKPSLCWAFSVGCQCDATRICCWGQAPAARRPQLSIDISCCRMLSSNPSATVAAVDWWNRQTDGRTDGRMLDRYMDPATHTMRAASVRALLSWTLSKALQTSGWLCVVCTQWAMKVHQCVWSHGASSSTSATPWRCTATRPASRHQGLTGHEVEVSWCHATPQWTTACCGSVWSACSMVENTCVRQPTSQAPTTKRLLSPSHPVSMATWSLYFEFYLVMVACTVVRGN